ncbi:MAG TPA: signal peptidase II [Longimicrobium sp.]|nr:signal peptidase II [Longimicrobium sp.]
MSDVMTDTRPRLDVGAAGDGRRKAALYLGATLGLIAIDQVTKLIVQERMRLYDPIPVIGDFFRLTYIYNRGAAFGLHFGEWSRVIFMMLPVVAVVFLFIMYRGTPWSDKVRLVSISLVTGGAIGNLIDRLRSSRGVVDFLDFGFGETRWPVFNVADIGVTIGALLLAVSLWREEQKLEAEEDADAV